MWFEFSSAYDPDPKWGCADYSTMVSNFTRGGHAFYWLGQATCAMALGVFSHLWLDIARAIDPSGAKELVPVIDRVYTYVVSPFVLFMVLTIALGQASTIVYNNQYHGDPEKFMTSAWYQMFNVFSSIYGLYALLVQMPVATWVSFKMMVAVKNFPLSSRSNFGKVTCINVIQQLLFNFSFPCGVILPTIAQGMNAGAQLSMLGDFLLLFAGFTMLAQFGFFLAVASDVTTNEPQQPKSPSGLKRRSSIMAFGPTTGSAASLV